MLPKGQLESNLVEVLDEDYGWGLNGVRVQGGGFCLTGLARKDLGLELKGGSVVN